jgi:hypothetical protein
MPRESMMNAATIASGINLTRQVHGEQRHEVIPNPANAMRVHVREARIGREYVQRLATVELGRAETCHAT